MKFTKILALMLVAVMCVSVFAACAKKEGGKTDGNETGYVSVTIIDHEGNEIFKNENLEIDLVLDSTDGKFYISNILDRCMDEDESLYYDYDENEKLLTINDFEAISGTKTEQVLDK